MTGAATMDYRSLLLAIAPRGNPTILAGFADALPLCIGLADLTTPRRLAMFLAQCAHECDGFATTTEYASGKAYDGRKDLGNTQPGDGPLFKGRGGLMLTGRDNYDKAGKALSRALTVNPASVAAFPTAALTAAWYWTERGLNKSADIADDAGAVLACTRIINGGKNGLAQRAAYFKVALAALADLKGTLVAQATAEKKQSATKTATATATIATAGAAPVIVSHPAVHAALSGGTIAVAVILAGILIGAAVYLVSAAEKHQEAAAALTVAAQGG